MESEWKRDGKGKENKFQIYWNQNLLEWNGVGMEMEQNFPNKKILCKKGMEMEWKQNGNGMENKWTTLVEIKFDGMEQKRKGNGMERLRPTMILTNGFGNGMEWKWKRNGI